MPGDGPMLSLHVEELVRFHSVRIRDCPAAIRYTGQEELKPELSLVLTTVSAQEARDTGADAAEAGESQAHSPHVVVLPVRLLVQAYKTVPEGASMQAQVEIGLPGQPGGPVRRPAGATRESQNPALVAAALE